MNIRTPVFVYADDPVSQAGLEQLLRGALGDLRRRQSGQIDDAAVAVVGCEEVDDDDRPDDRRRSSATAARACSSSPRGSTRRACWRRARPGTLGMLRRREATPGAPGRGRRATSPTGEASVPADLVGQLLGAVRRMQRGVRRSARTRRRRR